MSTDTTATNLPIPSIGNDGADKRDFVDPATTAKLGTAGEQISIPPGATADELLRAITDRLGTAMSDTMDDQTQTEIGRLLNVLPDLRDRDIQALRPQIELTLKALLATPPKLTLARTLMSDLNTTAQMNTNILARLVGIFVGQSPMSALFVGTCAGIGASGLIAAIMMVFWDEFQELLGILSTVGIVLILLFSSCFGAVVSLLIRLGRFARLTVYDPYLIFMTAASKPIIGFFFATVVYALLASGLISVPNFKIEDGGFSGSEYAFLWVIGFVSGFSERFAQDIVARAESTITSQTGNVLGMGKSTPK